MEKATGAMKTEGRETRPSSSLTSRMSDSVLGCLDIFKIKECEVYICVYERDARQNLTCVSALRSQFLSFKRRAKLPHVDLWLTTELLSK